MLCTSSESGPLWALMDCNNFYASCERLFRPDLEGRPIVVLSNNDGCIVARSREAKALGIPMGEPEYKARPLLKRHNVAVFSSNYALYGDISSRIMCIAETMVPRVEVYSIDEAFLYLDKALAGQAEDVSRALCERIRRWTGIAVSVGIAPTRTLAKLCNREAKKLGESVCCLPSAPEGRDRLLASTPVEEVWGIGRRQTSKLLSRGITTAAGLRDVDDVWLRAKLTISGWRTAMELRGLACIDEEHLPTPRRTLVSSRSFAQKVTEKAHLAEALTLFASRAGARLRAAKLLAGGIGIHLRTSRQDSNYIEENMHIVLAEPTADSGELIKAAHRGLDAVFRSGVAYAKAGVMLTDLSPAQGRQGNLLQLDREEHLQRRQRLMEALDAVNIRFGRQSLHYAAEGAPPPADGSPSSVLWHMRRKHCSPSFTTRWDDLAEALCK